ncbi:MAG: PAS domain S-box protein, partial [Anaerolineae bacterium]|nr:PAS domain S-box protein [Anaerolineae bacterium]
MSSQHITVLLIEDNPGDARLVHAYLAESTHTRLRLVIAMRLDEGLHRLKVGGIDAVLVDLSLPDSQGMETVERVLAAAGDVPVIVMTGLDDDETGLVAVSKGAQDFLVKDRVDSPLLIRTVRYAVERARTAQALRYQATLLEQVSDAVIATDRDFRVTSWNDAAEQLYGWTEAEALGQIIGQDILPTEYLDTSHEQVTANFLEAGHWRGEVVQYGRDGTPIHVLASVVALRDGLGHPSGVVAVNRDITDRKRAEEVLRNSETFLNSIIEHSPHAMWISDSQGTLLRQNQACRDLLHITDDEVVGKYNVLQDTIVAEQGYLPLVQRVFEQGERVRFMLIYETGQLATLQLAEHVSLVLDVTISPVLDAAGHVRHAIIQHVDITERQRAEQALANERNLLRTLIDSMPDYVYAKDTQGRFTLRNEASARNMGAASPEEMVGKTDFDYYAPDLAEQYYADDMAVIESGQPLINREELGIAADGTPGWLLTTKVPLRDSQGNVIGLVGMGRDISERKRVQIELSRLKEFNESIIQNMGDGVTIEDTEGIITFVNPAAARTLGYTQDELLGAHWTSITPDDQRSIVEDANKRRRLGGNDYYELEMLHKHGHRINVLISASPLFEEDRFAGSLAVFTDITGLKATEEALRHSEQRYRAISELSSDYAYAIRIEPDGTRVREWATESFTRITGYTLAELDTGNGWRLLVHPDDAAFVAEHVQRLYNGEAVKSEFRIITKTGDVRWLREHGHPVWDEDQTRVIRVYGTAEDITERKQAEAALHQRTAQLDLLYEAGKRLGSTLDIDTIYATLFDTLHHVMTCETLLISSFTTADQMIRCVYYNHAGMVLDPTTLPAIPLNPAGGGTQSVVIRTGQALYLADYQAHLKNTQTRYYVDDKGAIHDADTVDEDQEEEITRSALIVPLVLKGDTVGVIQVFSYRRDDFTPDDLRFLEALAPQVAAALDNARLYQQTQDELAERRRAEA